MLSDTLSFTENGCTFKATVGCEKVNCTVTTDAEITSFTLDIEPETDYMAYSLPIYLPDIIQQTTYFVLDYEMSLGLRGDIRDMFEHYLPDGNFSENNFTCDISTTEHNNGHYPVYVSCSLS